MKVTLYGGQADGKVLNFPEPLSQAVFVPEVRDTPHMWMDDTAKDPYPTSVSLPVLTYRLERRFDELTGTIQYRYRFDERNGHV